MAKLGEYTRKRDFSKTAEPRGGAIPLRSRGELRFVIQKHAASHLHYDFRLELDGVMKSWAVPKGPSVSPSVKRLAMEVEDHPIEYNTFEGTIPQGEYGGGTVMLWDRGTYIADEAGPDENVETLLKREYQAGKISITLQGERLRGSWALVRTDPGPRAKWLLIKHRDSFARKYEATEEFTTSVVTERTMEEIAGGRRVWHSNRASTSGARTAKKTSVSNTRQVGAAEKTILPTRPQSGRTIPNDRKHAFLVWHGGERMLAYATRDACAFVDAHGKDRTTQYAAIAKALAGLARRSGVSFVLDGELADYSGKPHYFVLDLLFAGDHAHLAEPWKTRRHALEKLFQRRRVAGVSIPRAETNGAKAMAHARSEDAEGILAIVTGSRYSPGKRTADWLVIPAT